MTYDQTPPYCSCPLTDERDVRVALHRRLRCEAHGPAARAQHDQLMAALADLQRSVERTVQQLSRPVEALFGPGAISEPVLTRAELDRWMRLGAGRRRRRGSR